MALPPTYLTSEDIYARYRIRIQANVRVNQDITPEDEKIRQLVVAGRKYYDARPLSPQQDSAYQEMKRLQAQGYHLVQNTWIDTRLGYSPND